MPGALMETRTECFGASGGVCQEERLELASGGAERRAVTRIHLIQELI